MSRLKQGIYDALVTTELRNLLRGLEEGTCTQIDQIEEVDCPEYLARHVVRQIKIALRSIPEEDRKKRQLELINQLLDFVDKQTQKSQALDSVDPAGEVLRAIYRSPVPPKPPTTPLAVNNLLMNAIDEPKLGFELERELANSDYVLMVVSFIQWRGWQRLKSAFHELAARGAPVRILTTTYIGATDLEAVQELARLPNVELRISLDGRRRRLHAKAWMFGRHNNFSSVYVGSANLSGPALEDGIEWTVKLSQVEAPNIVERFVGAFESLWCDPEFERCNPDDEDQTRRLRIALDFAKMPASEQRKSTPVFFDLRPHPFQQATLDRLEFERLDRNCFRNLVVAPTGTGKTLIAAFDYQRQPFVGRRPTLLFLAHREELLRQARDRFRHVLRDESFGEMLYGGQSPTSYDHLFATLQSLRSQSRLSTVAPNHWDYVVIDEAHHIPAESYRDILATLQPRILLGLTATPERMDGESILPWFNHRIADEMRLWHAIERQYLVPFDYYGIHDGTDLSQLSWSRGSYAKAELEAGYLNNRRRASLVLSQFCQIYGRWQNARALGFCVSIAHAQFMESVFRLAGVPAAAITSETPPAERAAATTRLRNREINVLFTVDLFNEGVDIPEVDCVLFLRPTESSTVFLQQLGRGLRLDTGKNNCLVLDFIGNQRREFRFDQRFSALFGSTRQQLTRELESGITRLPGNCYFHLDKESRKVILENLKGQLRTNRSRMVLELKALAQQQQGQAPSLSQFLAATGYELFEIYKPAIGGWSSLLQEAQLLETPLSNEDQALIARFHLLLHLDAVRRIHFHLSFATLAPHQIGELSLLQQRMAEMLSFRLLGNEARSENSHWSDAVLRLLSCPTARSEFIQCNQAMLDMVRVHTDDLPFLPDCPLFLHRQYMREEVFVALGMPDMVGKWTTQTGRVWLESLNTELFFVTLDKSEKSFSPSTRYEDFAVSPTRFHWQSQSTTSESSPTGQRYSKQRENGAQFLLFVRAKKNTPFLFLGRLRYVSHTGSRPMSIYWDLETAMPAWFFELCASLRAA